jgi:hypothetical protein
MKLIRGLPARADGWATWRAERLRQAGFSEPLANHVAHQSDVDIHALLELVDRGCRPDVAVRILAPLDPLTNVPADPERRP